MSSANFLSIQALADLRTTLLYFGADTEAALRPWMPRCARLWNTSVSVNATGTQGAARRAGAALQARRSRGYTDPKTGRTHIPTMRPGTRLG